MFANPSRPTALRTALLLVATLPIFGCSRQLDMPRLRAEIQKAIERQSGVVVLWVDCPTSRPAKPGDRFECRAGVPEGAVTVDVAQDEHATQWTQREQLLDARRLEEKIREGLRTHARLEATVTCPGARRPSIPGTRFVCQADPAGVRPMFEVPVLIKDTKGQVDWSVPKSALSPAEKGK